MRISLVFLAILFGLTNAFQIKNWKSCDDGDLPLLGKVISLSLTSTYKGKQTPGNVYVNNDMKVKIKFKAEQDADKVSFDVDVALKAMQGFSTTVTDDSDACAYMKCPIKKGEIVDFVLKANVPPATTGPVAVSYIFTSGDEKYEMCVRFPMNILKD